MVIFFSINNKFPYHLPQQAKNKKIYTQPYGVKKVFSALFRGQIKDSAREHKQTNLFLSKSILSLHFTRIQGKVSAKAIKKSNFRFDYAEPHPIFVSANIRKGNHSKKNLLIFLLSHISYSIKPKIHKEKLIMKNDNIFYLSKGFEREKFLRYL